MSRIDSEFYTTGEQDSNVCVYCSLYENGHLVCTAEDERLTSTQFRKALKAEYPDRVFTIVYEDGYWRGNSKK